MWSDQRMSQLPLFAWGSISDSQIGMIEALAPMPIYITTYYLVSLFDIDTTNPKK
jgi:hypothetical protein